MIPCALSGRVISAAANTGALSQEKKRSVKAPGQAGVCNPFFITVSTYTYGKNLADNQGPQANDGFCAENSCHRSADFYGRRSEYGNTFGPRTHNWTSTLIYQLPFGKGKRFANTSNPFVNGVIGGWQTSNIFLLQTGPFALADV